MKKVNTIHKYFMDRKMKSFKAYLGSPKTLVVTYGGRFQPFHSGHFSVYTHLVKLFGKENVFITTSDKVGDDSPFNFLEKKKIMTGMFDIPEDRIVKCANPAFAPVEIFKRIDGEIVYVAACGKKDESRYTSSKYFERFPKDAEIASLSTVSSKHGYYLVIPMMNDGMSGTEVRAELSNGDEAAFKKIYGKNNKKIFSLITNKLKHENI